MSKILIGERFGRLTVLNFSGTNHRNNAMWRCLCDCGITLSKIEKRSEFIDLFK